MRNGKLRSEGWATQRTSSSCSVFSVDDSALASAMNENGLPVEEKQSLSTAEISAPTASGKLDLTCWSFMLWSTTDLRSPWASEAPSSVTNFFAWKIDLSASGVGDHVPLAFWRHS